jgi:SAM-dependent methyltransferase
MDLFARETWDNYDAGGLIAQRLELIRKIMPPDVRTILDAGCGNGAVTNELYPAYDITGLDFSAAALEHVQAPKVQASVASIPFPDNSFDLVMCNEVLEHLGDEDLLAAVAELKRCTSRYLLISVPNKEQLGLCRIKCCGCGNVFHAYGHLQSFDVDTLDRLIGWERLQTFAIGPATRAFNTRLLRFRQVYLKQWFNPDFPISCPQCGGKEFWVRKSILTKALNGLARLGSKGRPYWLTVFYSAPDSFNTGSGE